LTASGNSLSLNPEVLGDLTSGSGKSLSTNPDVLGECRSENSLSTNLDVLGDDVPLSERLKYLSLRL
jgi:hypothetical protein